MKKFFWCLFRFNNYKISQDLNALIYKCIWLLDNCPNVSVKIDHYEIRITTSSTCITLWNANKFYAWLARGSVNGREYTNAGASAKALYDFKECLKKHGYDIYVQDPDEIVNIRIDDIKC